MDIKWSALGEVALVSFGVGVAIVAIFSIGILAMAQGGEDGAPVRGGVLNNVAAALCFLACAAIVAYGIYLIVPQFH
jgi:hypothetical protein